MTARTTGQLARSRPKAGFPVVTILYLVVLFVVVGSDYRFSLKMEDLSWREETVDLVVHGNVKRQLIFVAIGAYGVIALRKKGRRELQPRGVAGWTMVWFAAWALMSILWSDSPALTAKRLFVFSTMCASALAFAARFSIRDLVALTFVGAATSLGTGLVAEVVLGTFKPWAAEYRFAGTAHPNASGLMCAMFVLAAVAAADLSEQKYRFFEVCAFAGFCLLVLTKSRTAFIAAVVAVAAYKNLFSKVSKKIQFLLGVMLLFMIIFVLYGETIFPVLEQGILLGRAQEGVATLTGRSGLWGQCIQYVLRRPILGYGFESFWTTEHIEKVSDFQGWGISASHSIYLEYLLTLGFIGLTFFLLFMSNSVLFTRRVAKVRWDHEYGFAFGLLILFLTHGTLDSMSINPGFPMFLVMVALMNVGFLAVPRQEDRSTRTQFGHPV